MSQEINKAEKQDLSLVVRAIGSDLEHTQVRMIASANADMLFHYWKVGHFILYLQKKEGWGSKVIDNLSKLYAHNILTRRDTLAETSSICASLLVLIRWKY